MKPVVFLAAVLLSLCSAAPAAVGPFSGPVRVIDGDTVDVGAVRVRLFGIDAPEADQTCQRPDGADWACGDWVTREVNARYAGRMATCLEITTDRYGRSVARCSVAGQDMGRALVQTGLAFAYRHYAQDYVPDERRAAAAKAGLHASRVQSPAQFRKARQAAQTQAAAQAAAQPAAQAAAPQDCAIKGNISAKGVRIFHSPGQRDYDATRISPTKGERWFCTPAQARAAGWRAARR